MEKSSSYSNEDFLICKGKSQTIYTESQKRVKSCHLDSFNWFHSFIVYWNFPAGTESSFARAQGR